MSNLINLQGVTKRYGSIKNPVLAVDSINLSIPKGSFTVILGRSGSGKSTLLNLMAGLDKVSEGEISIDGVDLSNANSRRLAKYRSQIGIIFQFYNLLPSLNTLDNVRMGAWAGGKKIEESKAIDLLTALGLEHRIKANVKTLSGGEKQRVAIARSLVSDPNLIFCDEPTGALDSSSENQVQEILIDLHKKQGKTIVLVTHNPEFEKLADTVITMSDGKIVNIKTK